jgi:Tfp pilus assembly PilM family ATPase
MLNQQGLKKVVFCGGGSQLRGILSFMSKELDMPVELGNPTTNLVRGGAARGLIKENFPTFATAIGLALRQPDNKKDYEL